MATSQKEYQIHNIHNNKLQHQYETILVNQGGGSLGAYECGVCKVLAKYDIKFDIIAGTSIGGINAAILAAGYSKKYGIRDSVKTLENFWMDLAEKHPPLVFCSDKQRSELAALNALFWGIPKAFTPIWIERGGSPFYYFFNSPYLYDITRFKNTISKYVDFTKLQRRTGQQQSEEGISSGSKRQQQNYYKNNKHDDAGDDGDYLPSRLILTATNIQTGEPTTFDSNNMDITIDHVMASAGYAVYGLPWTKINNSYFWDGSFVHNTPLKSVIKASPRHQKIAYISDVFPLKQEKLASNMPETYHRVRDMLFHDTSIRLAEETSDIVKKHVSLIEKMHKIIFEGNKENSLNYHHKNAKTKSKLDEIEKEYNDLVSNGLGVILEKLIHIERKESKGHRYIFEDADFSIATINKLIQDGERDTEDALIKNKIISK
jgi:NTE family protein